MKDASSPAVAPSAAPSPVSPGLHYVLEAEWPHRAVPTTARQRRDAAREAAREARADAVPVRNNPPTID